MSNKSESLVFVDDRPTSLDDTLYQWALDAEDMIREMQKHIDDLNKENASLKKDAARLDWIDKVGEVHICRVREGSVSGNLRWDVEYGYYGGLAKSKKGMRQAIDTAMQKD